MSRSFEGLRNLQRDRSLRLPTFYDINQNLRLVFPGLEEALGRKGLMDVNVEQHKALHDELDVWGKKCDTILLRKIMMGWNGGDSLISYKL